MNDFAFVAILLAFFVLAALFVAGCDRIIGDDEQTLAETAPADPEREQMAA